MLIFYDIKLKVFVFWTVGRRNSQFKDVSWGSGNGLFFAILFQKMFLKENRKNKKMHSAIPRYHTLFLYVCADVDVNSHVGPAVVPCLRLPVLWAQTDSQLEGCGEHHVGHHTQQAWQKREATRGERQRS